MDSLRSVCDDFGVTVSLASKLDLPLGRETILSLFESLRRQFPELTEFDRRDESDHVLEVDRDSVGAGGPHKWVGVDRRRLAVGFTNPASGEAVDALVEAVLATAPDHLGLTRLDAETLDVVYSFDLTCAGNHDAIVAEALAAGGPLDPFLRPPAGKVLMFQPSLTVALDDACQLQARLAVETRSTAYQVRVVALWPAPLGSVVQPDEVPEGTDVVPPALRERQRLADEPPAPLPQGTPEPLDVIRPPLVFAGGGVPVGRDGGEVRRPEVGADDGPGLGTPPAGPPTAAGRCPPTGPRPPSPLLAGCPCPRPPTPSGRGLCRPRTTTARPPRRSTGRTFFEPPRGVRRPPAVQIVDEPLDPGPGPAGDPGNGSDAEPLGQHPLDGRLVGVRHRPLLRSDDEPPAALPAAEGRRPGPAGPVADDVGGSTAGAGRGCIRHALSLRMCRQRGHYPGANQSIRRTANYGVLHRSAVLGEAAMHNVCGVLPKPTTATRQLGGGLGRARCGAANCTGDRGETVGVV